MYGYQGAAQYGRPPQYGGYPNQPAPGMGAPPGMAAPGTAPAPGMENPDAQQGRPAGFPSSFQGGPSMPNINFNAPVIRLGTTGPGKPLPGVGGEQDRRQSEHQQQQQQYQQQRGPRAGLGLDINAQRQAVRENMMQLIPPTKEEVVRTIFIGGITEGAGGDEGIEKILRCIGNLKRWIRAMDADNKACRFGFAEYEDPESLATAVEVLKGVEVPVKPQAVRSAVKTENGEEAEVEKSKLLVMVDDATYSFLDQWEASRGDRDPIQGQLRLDAAKSGLATVLSDLLHPSAPNQFNEQMSKIGEEGASSSADGKPKDDTEVITIPLSADDELADIPAELREQVAKEIQAFRDRSARRDLERLRREEEMEAMERKRAAGGRASRLASPPASASHGPGGGANGIPLGPRERGVLNAPAGPKGYDSQKPVESQKGVSFVNGSGVNGAGAAGLIDREFEDSDASDEEIERRRREKKAAEQDKLYQDQKRRWLNRERSRTAALERESGREKDTMSLKESAKDAMARRLKDWNDDAEASRKVEEYYADRSSWIRTRAAFRAREANLDDMDRAAEQKEKARERQQQERARGMADDFLNRQAMEMAAPREPQRFKLSLGAAAQKAQQANTGKRTVAEVEGLLEDEGDADATTKRTLIPIKFDNAADAAGLTEEERQQAARQLAADIPSDTEGLWAWPVKWEFVDESVLTDQLRPFVEKKIVEYLGVQEQMLVEVVEEHVRKRGDPKELVGELEGALDEEAENLVKKLWRMIIFFSESEKRGLSA